jgi:hypothetical protein
MASEIKVDTISEKTSAAGVTIDGVLIKDGDIPAVSLKMNKAKTFFALNG